MNRPWLTTSLIGVIAAMGGIGVHHEARVELERGLSRFQATLPPGATFTYSSAHPAILARGAVLTDVILQNGNQTFRASKMHVGHPQSTPDGGLVISSLDIRDPSVQTPSLIMHADALSFRKLVTPPPEAGSTNLTTINLDHVALAHGRVDHLTIQNIARAQSASTPQIYNVTSDKVSIDGYGPTTTTTLSLTNTTAIVGRTIIKPGQPPRPFSAQLSLQTFRLKQASLPEIIGALQNGTPTPLNTPPAESFSADGFQISAPVGNFRIDRMTGSGKQFSGVASSQFLMSGLHVRVPGKMLPLTIDGAHSSVRITQHNNPQTGEANSNWQLAIPSFANVTLNLHLTLPAQEKDKIVQRTSQQILNGSTLSSLAISVQGDRFINGLSRLTSNTKLDDAGLASAKQRNVQVVSMLLAPFPNLGAVPDFLSDPKGRTLTLSYAPASPLPLGALGAVASRSTSILQLINPNDLKAVVQ